MVTKNIKKIILYNVYILFILFLTGLIISCEDSNNSEPTEGGLIDGVYTVFAGNMYYNPTTITISIGDSITFINEQGFHDVYTTSGPVELSLNPCSSPCTIGTLVFEVAGEYNYICSIGSHAEQGMIGTIIVNP